MQHARCDSYLVSGMPNTDTCPQVEEEIGYQISNLINEQYIAEQNIRGQRVTLFMVPNVPEDYPFETHTRKEISVSFEAFRGFM